MNEKTLVGYWKLIESDPSLDLGENDEMEFKETGELIYAIDAGSKWQIMNLLYQVDGNYLITEQPSSPNEQRTLFGFENNEVLVLYTDGVIEAKDIGGDEYGNKRLEHFIKENRSLSVELFNQKLLRELNIFSSNNLKDDIFILNIKTK